MTAKNYFLMCFAVGLFGAIAASGQELPKNTVAPNKSWTRVDPFGGVTLPTGFTYVRPKNRIDAWLGVIKSSNGSFVIKFAAGMVESGAPKDKKKLIWQKTIEVKIHPDDQDARPIQIFLYKHKKKKLIHATIGWAKFSAYVKDTSEQETFVAIVSSYRSLQRVTKPS